MPYSLDEFLLNVRVADVLDVLIVSFVIYVALKWMRRRASRAVAGAAATVAAVYLTSHLLKMYLTMLVFQIGLTLMLLTLIIIFQQDLRHAFGRFSSWRPFRRSAPPSRRFIDTLSEAVAVLAAEKIGALIVLTGRQPVERLTHGGVPVGAELSVPLLHSIFHNKSRGHDGAVIVKDEKIQQLEVHLPLSTNLQSLGESGTRHAAALGMAERCDAFVVVVSEERGVISVAQDGRLQSLESSDELDARLSAFHRQERRSKVRRLSMQSFLGDTLLKISALAFALLLWLVFAFRIDIVQRSIDDVQVEFRNLPPDVIIESYEPATAQLELAGPERDLDTLDGDALKVSIDVSNLPENAQMHEISEDDLQLPDNVRLQKAEPSEISLARWKVRGQEAPIQAATRGRLPPGVQLRGITLSPASASLFVREERDGRLEQIFTEPIDLSEIHATQKRKVKLRLPQGVKLAEGASPIVEATVEVAEQTNQ